MSCMTFLHSDYHHEYQFHLVSESVDPWHSEGPALRITPVVEVGGSHT